MHVFLPLRVLGAPHCMLWPRRQALSRWNRTFSFKLKQSVVQRDGSILVLSKLTLEKATI